jgi:hypothetical protein
MKKQLLLSRSKSLLGEAGKPGLGILGDLMV